MVHPFVRRVVLGAAKRAVHGGSHETGGMRIRAAPGLQPGVAARRGSAVSRDDNTVDARAFDRIGTGVAARLQRMLTE